MTTRRARWSSVALGGALAFAAGRAYAGDVAGAEALFREGRALWTAGNVDAACGKFAESERMDPSPGTLLNLAACHEKQGKLATAWAEFVGTADLASRRGEVVQADEARKRAAGLVARLPRLTVRLAEPVQGLSVRRDDVELTEESLGTALPVDPGQHHVVASAPGRVAVALDVEVREAESREVLVPALPIAPPDAAKTPPATRDAAKTPSAEAVPPPHPLPPPAARSHDAVLGWVIGGAGVALAATGGALYLLSVSDDQNAQKGCLYHDQGHWACSEAAMAAGRERDTLATLATVSGAVGIAGIGVGLYFLLRPEPHPSRVGSGPRLPLFLPEVTPHGTALYLRESFE